MRAAMGFDIGGGSGRCLLLDLESGRSLCAGRAWGDGGLAAEIDLDSAFARLAEAAREVLARAGNPEVVGIAAAGMRFGTVVLDAAGEALLTASNRDSRASLEALTWAAEEGEAAQQRTGHWPTTIQTAARLRWMRGHAPEALGRAAHVLSLDGWLAFRLCGVAASDLSQAGVSGLYDLRAGAWAADAAGLGPPLPELRPSGEPLGGLSESAAGALGLPAGTPVVMGGADTQCGLLGLGAATPGQAGAVCGTTMPLQQVLAGLPPGMPAALWIEPHVVPGRFVAESNAGPAGDAVAWLGAVLFPDAPRPAERLLAEAAAAPPGAGGMLSTFGGQVMDARALALPVGDLTLSHVLGGPSGARGRLARAVVEGIAFAARANLEQLAAAAGGEASELRVGGGMARSRSFVRALAEVSGRPVRVAREVEATALGAALCAAVGGGAFADLDAAASALVGAEPVAPGAEAEAWVGSYPRWQELRAARAGAAALVQSHAIQVFLAGAAGGAAVGREGGRPRILATAQLDDEALSRLRALGEVEYASYRDRGRLLQGGSLVEALQGFQVFVTEIDLVDGGSLLELPELRVVAACRGDAVNVDVGACTACGVPVLHAPGRNADAVADLALLFALALLRKLPEAESFLRDPSVAAGDMGAMGRAYATLRGRELWGKTFGLVGLGAVGRKVAERARAFGARVLAHDPFLEPERAALAGVELVALEALLEASDVVSLHAAVTPESEGLIGAKALARMKPGALLVNTARAALVDEEALAEALASGHLGGAALDVFSEEPPGADHPLLGAPHVIATPHVGGNTAEVGAHQGRIVSDDLARLLGGGSPLHVLNRETLAGFSLDRPHPALDEAARAALRERPPPAVTDLQKKGGARRRA